MIQQVEKLKEIINQNSMGHLPLPYRVDLMKRIGNARIVQKILCECCKKACSCFSEEFGAENLLYSALFEIDSYLYKNKGTIESISVSVERLRNYAEQSIESCEDMAGWAIIALGYAIQNDAASILEIEDYNGEDDNTFDFESWNVDFICSIAYSGSNPFVEIEKSKVPAALARALKMYPEVKTIVLHLDNDRIGRLATKAIFTVLPKQYQVKDVPPKQGKDYNDLLCIKLNLAITKREKSTKKSMSGHENMRDRR